MENQIEELLQKCLSGLGSEQDWTLLKIELEKKQNAKLQEELLGLAELTAADLVVDEEKMWDKISEYKKIGRNRLNLSRRFWHYAAAVVIPLFLGGMFVWVQHLREVPSSARVAAVGFDHSRAILKLDNGEQIDLSGTDQDTILVYEGVSIRLDSARCIQYQSEYSGIQTSKYNTLIVPKGGEYRLVLADGSVVWLNSDSELRYPVVFTGKQRKVFLKGEAYFEVAKNPEVPFMVDVADMEVRVLGTCFNVNAYRKDGIFQTTLVRGKVQVSDLKTTKSVVLEPDQQALVHDGQLSVRSVDAAIYTAWREGKFYFESETMEEIAAQLERWYDIHFFFSREELRLYEFTGVIRKDYTIGQILDIIIKTTDVRFEVTGTTINVCSN